MEVTRQSKASPKEPASDQQELTQLFPWLQEKIDEEEGFEDPRPSKKAKASSSEQFEAAPLPTKELADEQIEVAMKSLDDSRAELAAHAGSTQEDFGTRALGSARWAMIHRGVACDAVQGFARNALAKDFLVSRDLKETRRFDVSAYGFTECGVLARAWASRAQYFLNAWYVQPELSGRPFPPHVVGGYEEPSEFTTLATHAAGRTRTSVQNVRNMFV